ncbi:MAG: acyl-CoA dehydrogenase [Desulfobacteraceae bacterium]|nr:MAG: acyl-CoA dehydrogenase [Desulfobacteraceae bacterium]
MEEINDHHRQMEELRKLARKIAQERIAPHASECDQNGRFPWESIHSLGDAQFPGIVLSEDSGGADLGRVCFAAVVEEIAKACASTALVFVSHASVAKAIELAADEAIKKRWLPTMLTCRSLGAFAVHEPDSGSNAGAITTKAKRDGDFYVVNGSKFFITSAGEADVYLILVKNDPEKGPQGMSTLLVEKETPGLSFSRPEDKMGLRGTSSRQMFFNDCRIPVQNRIGEEGEGMGVIGKSVVGWGFYGAAAISVGIAKAAVEASVRHAKERTIADQPIGIHQAVQFMLSDMILGSESTETYLSACAAKADAFPTTAPLNGFKAKLHASETAIEVTNKAIQVLGGHGYCRDYIVERLFRDARGLTLHFKTSEWLRQDIAKAALGL